MDEQLFHIDFILVQNSFCWPFFLRAAKRFSAHFIADSSFLDQIRYNRYMNWHPESGQPIKMLEIWYPLNFSF